MTAEQSAAHVSPPTLAGGGEGVSPLTAGAVQA